MSGTLASTFRVLQTWRDQLDSTERGAPWHTGRVGRSSPASSSAYEDRGNGEPVVLIDPGHFADWLKPLLDEPALTARHRVISYDRAGCGRSGRRSRVR